MAPALSTCRRLYMQGIGEGASCVVGLRVCVCSVVGLPLFVAYPLCRLHLELRIFRPALVCTHVLAGRAYCGTLRVCEVEACCLFYLQAWSDVRLYSRL